jgi:hypothetical protein
VEAEAAEQGEGRRRSNVGSAAPIGRETSLIANEQRSSSAGLAQRDVEWRMGC